MSRKKKWIAVGVIVLTLLSCGILLPCVQYKSDINMYGNSSRNQLRQIGNALHMYYEDHKSLPPPIVRDKDGQPLYSWRVLLLPYLEGEPGFGKFKLEEAWDSPHNKNLIKAMPSCFFTPGRSESEGFTHYQLLIGRGTAFELPQKNWELLTNGLSETILVVEAAEPVPWSKPADLTYDPKKPLPALGDVSRRPVYFLCRIVDWKPGFNALFGGGHVRFIDSDTDEKTLRALITRNGGEKVDLSKLDN